MRISTSTIVMAALVCIPFGLAIRDTIKEPALPSFEVDGQDDDNYVESAAENARYEAEQAAQEALDHRNEQARKAVLGELLGAEPASLGGGFGSLRLGERDQVVLAHASERFEHDAATNGYEVNLVATEGELVRVEITPADGEEAACRTLTERLGASWGEGHYDTNTSATEWVNESTGQRAALVDSDGCSVAIERFVAPDKLLGKAATSIIPIAAIGRSLKELQASHPTAELDGEFLKWSTTGVGFGSGPTQLLAVSAGGRVTSITAYAEMAPATQDAVAARLTALYGEPTTEGGMLLWNKGHVGMDTTNPSTTSIIIGRIAE